MFVFLAAATLQVTPVESPTSEEIVVVAQLARKFRYRVSVDRKTEAVKCEILRASGDPVLDARLCESAVVCIPAGLRPAGKPSKQLVDQVRACLQPREKAIIAQRAAERSAAARGLR